MFLMMKNKIRMQTQQNSARGFEIINKTKLPIVNSICKNPGVAKI
jgi:hypothetical protein